MFSKINAPETCDRVGTLPWAPSVTLLRDISGTHDHSMESFE
jgi:hypothetical protein